MKEKLTIIPWNKQLVLKNGTYVPAYVVVHTEKEWKKTKQQKIDSGEYVIKKKQKKQVKEGK